ncbi:recombinase family protein [Fusobacterium hwasookii]|uniref:Resolvase domain protein n=1 Tax=Fusobacterium hwasookii ChDC F128 TaxID=1216362 RepID=A0ABP2R208_9FUSO|nr:recombinase family protein [Fusobacterium hwasookii]EJU06724.1 Resolvase domain protein [Fusobacterium hwasookii ChDC F128]QNE67353.1 recombinase family protein [Fusobacterium hwasookii]
MEYGYIRVSTEIQDHTRQEKALLEYGILAENIYSDIGSGKDFNRPQYQKLINKVIKAGDTLVITSLDRLGRDMKLILENYNLIVDTRGVTLISLEQPELNSTNPILKTVMLSIYTMLADIERKTMLERQRQAYNSMKKTDTGKLISNKTGEVVGRKKASHSFRKEDIELLKKWIDKTTELTTNQVLKALDISRPTLYKLKKEYLNGELKI